MYAGAITEEDKAGPRCRTSGDLVFRSQPEPHRNETLDRPSRILCVEIDAARLQELDASALESEELIVAQSSRSAELARLAAVTLRADDTSSRLRLRSIVYELLALTVQAAERRSGDARVPSWLPALERRLARDPASKLTAQSLSRELDLSPKRLARELHEHRGMSLLAWLRAQRVRAAMKELDESCRSLALIAEGCGFYDQSHFTRVFKELTGFTPGEFRRREG